MLQASYIQGVIEAGCDEAGRGPLAGSVFAAAVILDPKLLDTEEHREWLAMLNDSKQLTEKERSFLRPKIEQFAQAWAVVEVTAEEIASTPPSLGCNELWTNYLSRLSILLWMVISGNPISQKDR